MEPVSAVSRQIRPHRRHVVISSLVSVVLLIAGKLLIWNWAEVAVWSGLAVLFGFYSHLRNTVTLTPDVLMHRTAGLSRQSIPWTEVQAVTVRGKAGYRAIHVYFQPAGRLPGSWPDCARLGIDGSVGRNRAQQRARAEIEQWWIEHRGPSWRPHQQGVPLTFPPDVNPYAPPARD